jgi:hypothetical protein
MPAFAQPTSLFQDPEQAVLQRKLAEAEALRQSGQSGDIGQGYRGGKVFIVGNLMSKLANAAGGAYLGDQAEQEHRALMDKRQAEDTAWQDRVNKATSSTEEKTYSLPEDQAGPVGTDTAVPIPVERQVQNMNAAIASAPQFSQYGQAAKASMLSHALNLPYERQKQADKIAEEERANKAYLEQVGMLYPSTMQSPTNLTGREQGVGFPEQVGFTGDPQARLADIQRIPAGPDRDAAMAQLNQQMTPTMTNNIPPYLLMGGTKAGAKIAPLLAAADRTQITEAGKNTRQEDQQAFTAGEHDKQIAARIEAAKKEPPNPETTRLIAERFIAGDKNAMVGLSRNGPLHQAVLNDIAILAKEQGLNAKELIQRGLEYSGASAEQQTMGHRAAQVNMAALEAREMIPIMTDLSKKVDRTKYPNLNSVINAWEQGTGDENIVAFGQSIESLINAYARAISPAGVGTVSDKEAARKRLDQAFSVGQIDAVANVMNQEIEAALKSPTKARQAARASFTGTPSVLPKATGSVVDQIPTEPPRLTKSTGAPRTFNTEAEAAAAGLAPGTPVIINGVKGSWQ